MTDPQTAHLPTDVVAFALESPALPAGLPVAHVFGQPVLEAPQDLFIPPDALQVILESFEGPLDLLLYLIRKQNINVLDIPMTQICEQYLSYIQTLQERLALAAEYLLMAALLIDIKSLLLLPRPVEDPAEEEEDPRAELVRRLLEYEQMKLAALELDHLSHLSSESRWVSVLVEQELEQRMPEVQPADLKAAWLALLTRCKQRQHHQVKQDSLSVRVQMSWLLRQMANREFLIFEELLAPDDNLSVLVVNFIALLELVREGLIQVTQAGPYQTIYLHPPQRTLPEIP